jgi:hypothetical protein
MSVAVRRVVLLLLLGLMGTLRWFDVHPVVVEAEDSLERGWPFSDTDPSDVLLLVDQEVVSQAAKGGRFDWADWSWGWANLLEQEVGRFAVNVPGEIRLGALDGRRVLVVTRSATAASELWLPRLRTFVDDGGVLIVERPSNRWAPLTGVQSGRGSDPVVSLTKLPESVAPEHAAELEQMPWLTKPLHYRPTATTPLRVLVEADGLPVIVMRRSGKGSVITIGFDVGRQVTALQQGTPDQGSSFALTNRYTDVLSGHLEANDLVADRRLLGATIPFADQFERLIMATLHTGVPLPRWWLYPNAAPGAYLCTHDEERMGDAAAWMADAEAEWGFTSTFFVIPDSELTSAGIGRMSRTGQPVGLHQHSGLHDEWGYDGPHHKLGVGRVRPGIRPWSYAEQADWVGRLVGAPPKLNRNHYLLWDAEWSLPFRKMAGAGIRLDSTYGPDVRTRGYLFATGLPFFALDRNGHPLPVRELPFLTAEDLGGADRAFHFKLLRESAERYHTAVTTLFHPNVFRWRPKRALYELWRDDFEEAKRLGLWITDMGELLRFIEARRVAPLTSTFDGGLLVVTADAGMEGMTLALPSQWEGSAAGPVTVDGKPVQITRMPQLGGDLLLIPLESGSRTIVVDYPAPATKERAPRRSSGSGR